MNILKRPPSEQNLYVNLLALVSFFAYIGYVRIQHVAKLNDPLGTSAIDITSVHDQTWITMMAMLAAVAPILLFDLFAFRMYNKPQAALGRRRPFDPGRIAIKLVGFFTTLGVIALLYWALPEYTGGWYARFYEMLRYLLPIMIVGAFIYLPLVDRHMKEPEDGYWHVGRFVLSPLIFDRKSANMTVIAEHGRSWAVKAFFVPLMFTFLSNNINFLVTYDYSILNFSALESYTNSLNFSRIYDFFYTFIFTVDVVFAAVGYIVTLRVLNSQIRSVEPTVFGWVICIVCYPPFWAGLFSGQYFAYDNDMFWGGWLAGHPIAYLLWGITILVLISIYSLATVALGYRFSNLTYRGLVTSGPYRFTKHPAYICKCLSWWLVSIPFLSGDTWQDSLRMSALLFGVCMIYFFRARTEENHLSNYPEYVEYANWMREHGVFRHVGRLIPYLAFDETRAARAGSVIWSRKAQAGRGGVAVAG